jgi:uncharacterized damage-inducible protein DinB
MMKPNRKGPFGALMYEYERAAADLNLVLAAIPLAEYDAVKDAETKDPDCVSVKTIMSHVVRSGYGYSIYIRKQFGNEWKERRDNYELHTPVDAIAAMAGMLSYAAATLEDKWDLTFEQVSGNIIQVPWGQKYDAEQLMEHAIVHVLRHRRQIENFMKR